MGKDDFFITVENWKNIDKDMFKLMFERGNERLTDLIEAGALVTTRVYSLIIIILAFFTFTFRFMTPDIFNLTMILPVILLIYALIQSFQIIYPRVTEFHGQDPRQIPLNAYVDDEKYNEKEQYIAFLIGQIENTQYQIDNMRQENERRFRKLNKCIISVISAIVISLIFIFIKSLEIISLA